MADTLPIALRRTRRSTSSLPGALPLSHNALVDVHSPPLTPTSLRSSQSPASRVPNSPRTPSSKSARHPRRVRFSDPGQLPPTPSTPSTPRCACSSPTSTGLTPFIRRASLQAGLPVSGDVNILPLRQVLDGRVQRRLRRNGLSEEMNSLHAERRHKAAFTKKTLDEEVLRLRAEVAAKNEQIQRLRVAAPGSDGFITTRYDDDVEHEAAGAETFLPDQTYDWKMAARDPFELATRDADGDNVTTVSDGASTELIGNTDDLLVFGDTTMADLQCSTPVRPRQQRRRHVENYDMDSQRTISFSVGGSSFPSPPASSPLAWAENARSGANGNGDDNGDDNGFSPPTPVTPKLHLFSTQIPSGRVVRSVDMEVQAALPDPASDQLRSEMNSLKRDHDTLQDRMAALLRDLADKTAALQGLSASLQEFLPRRSETNGPVLDAADIVDHLGEAFRTARLELEYLTPGEIALPLSAPVVEVLDLLLVKLRQLAQQVTAADDQLDEYHAIEGDLRKQLGARVDAMDALVAEVAAGQDRLESREKRIQELELGADRFRGALASYARDVAELESVVHQLEASLKARDSQVEALAAAHANHGPALALRDARMHKLRAEMEETSVALRAAHESAHKSAQRLRAENSRLETRLGAETERTRAAKAAVASLQAVLETDSSSQGQEAAPVRKRKRLSLGKRIFGGSRVATTAATVIAPLAKDGSATEELSMTPSRSARKRRRFDDGLGHLDEETTPQD
ncbi:hypothetical protein SEPCBS119000_003901 [Sporothrix epigloea]|uniref:Uncharacterized protein n=1 Tax=Sporothrix epigloea TaxID=1892477 RepID=A0ABP0DRA0_9PEZI